jgi:hypothetical protein
VHCAEAGWCAEQGGYNLQRSTPRGGSDVLGCLSQVLCSLGCCRGAEVRVTDQRNYSLLQLLLMLLLCSAADPEAPQGICAYCAAMSYPSSDVCCCSFVLWLRAFGGAVVQRPLLLLLLLSSAADPEAPQGICAHCAADRRQPGPRVWLWRD